MDKFINLLLLLGIISTITCHPRSMHPEDKLDTNIIEIVNKNTSCSHDIFSTTLTFSKPFKGVIYAKGYPNIKIKKSERKCFAVGNGTKTSTIHLNPTSCGVKLIPINDENLAYSVNLVLQTDRYLQQVTNFKVSVLCMVSAKALSMPLRKELKMRSGRKLGEESVAGEKIENIRSWMEIKSANSMSQVKVGDPLTIYVKTLLPASYTTEVVDCVAYDGLRERSELLSDSYGCSYDEDLMPTMKELKNEQKMAETEWNVQNLEKPTDEHDSTAAKTILRVTGTSFTAFKFADAANLHIKCSLVVCKNACPHVPCNATLRRGRETGEVEKKIVEKLDVFNSIQVLAPGLDITTYRSNKSDAKNEEENFCLSTSKLAFALAIIGGIFLFAVLTALCAMIRVKNLKARNAKNKGRLYLIPGEKIPNVQRRQITPMNSFR